MPELGTLGSERGALSNERPYRDHVVFKPRLFCGPSRADAVRPASTATTSKFITAVYGGGRSTTLR